MSVQTSIFDEVINDNNEKLVTIEELIKQIEDSISEELRDCFKIVSEKTKQEKINTYFIRVVAPSSNWRLTKNSATIAKVHFGKRLSYIAFSLTSKQILKENNINYTYTNSEGLARITISDFIKIPNEIIGFLCTDTILNSFGFQQFGCCGKYNDCIKANKCLHDDKLYATACQMKKILPMLHEKMLNSQED